MTRSFLAPLAALGLVLALTGAAQDAGELDADFVPALDPTRTSGVWRLAVTPGGKTLVHGSSRDNEGWPREWLTRLNDDGSVDAAFGGPVGFDVGLAAVVALPEERVLVAGPFTRVNGSPATPVVRLNADGSLDASYAGGDGALQAVFAGALQPDGRLLCAGNLNSPQGILYNRLVRLLPDGRLDPNFNAPVALSGSVRVLAVQSDEKILVGGDFPAFGSGLLKYLARLNPNGSVDPGFNTALGLNGTVTDIQVQADDQFFIAGTFSRVEGKWVRPLVRLTPDGTLDTPFATDVAFTYPETIPLLQDDGKVLCAGTFRVTNSLGQVVAKRLIRLASDGRYDRDFTDRVEVNDAIYSLVRQPDDKLLIAGRFAQVNGQPRPGLARLWLGPPAAVADLALAWEAPAGAWTLGEPGEIRLRLSAPGTTPATDVRIEVFPPIGAEILAADCPGGTFQCVLEDGGVRCQALEEVTAAEIVLTLRADTWDRFRLEATVAASTSDPFDANNTARIEVPTRLEDDFWVYEHDFEVAPVGPEWSTNCLYSTPVGGRRFLGLFGPQEVVLALPGLGSHTAVSVSFDLYLARSWDGNSTSEGPDVWSLRVGGGPVLFQTTFNTQPHSMADAWAAGQAFPDFFPGGYHLPFSGAAETNRLGFTLNAYDSASAPADAVYHLEASFAHAAETLQLVFDARLAAAHPGASWIYDEAWGLDNVRVRAVDCPAGVLAFAARRVQVNRSESEAVLEVRRIGGTAGEVQVEFLTADGTAVAGTDYVAQSGVLSFGEGVAWQTVRIPLLADPGATTAREFTVRLHTPTGSAALGTTPFAFVQLHPVVGSLAFAQERYAVPELDGAVPLTFARNGDPGVPASLEFVTRERSAIPGKDYRPQTNMVTFPPGVIHQIVTLSGFADNASAETDKEIGLEIVQVSGDGMLAGQPALAVVTLLDDDSPLGPGIGTDGAVGLLAAGPDGTLLVAGAFTTANGTPYGRLARYRSDGMVDREFGLAAALPEPVTCLAVQPDGGVLVGGGTVAGGQGEARLVRVLSDGRSDPGFAPVELTGGLPRGMVVDSLGRIVVVGDFLAGTGVAQRRLIRLLADGTPDPDFNVGTGADASVAQVAIASEDRIYVAGDFWSLNGIPGSSRVARLLPDGALDPGFFSRPPITSSRGVTGVLLVDDERLLIATQSWEGQTELSRLRGNGMLDPDFLRGAVSNGTLSAMVMLPTGQVLIAGDFGGYGERPCNRIARLNPEGTFDATFAGSSGPNGPIHALAVLSDGRVVAGGDFTRYDGFTRHRLAWLDPTGRLETRPPRILRAALDEEGFPALTLEGEPNRRTTVMRSFDLRVWEEAEVNVPARRFAEWSDSQEQPARFYRVRQEW
jgi:uncharacterized delta-60 repeat protein